MAQSVHTCHCLKHRQRLQRITSWPTLGVSAISNLQTTSLAASLVWRKLTVSRGVASAAGQSPSGSDHSARAVNQRDSRWWSEGQFPSLVVQREHAWALRGVHAEPLGVGTSNLPRALITAGVTSQLPCPPRHKIHHSHDLLTHRVISRPQVRKRFIAAMSPCFCSSVCSLSCFISFVSTCLYTPICHLHWATSKPETDLHPFLSSAFLSQCCKSCTPSNTKWWRIRGQQKP